MGRRRRAAPLLLRTATKALLLLAPPHGPSCAAALSSIGPDRERGAIGSMAERKWEREAEGIGLTTEASPHRRRLKCDTKHQSQEADATFITSDGSKPYKPWRTLDTDNNNK